MTLIEKIKGIRDILTKDEIEQLLQDHEKAKKLKNFEELLIRTLGITGTQKLYYEFLQLKQLKELIEKEIKEQKELDDLNYKKRQVDDNGNAEPQYDHADVAELLQSILQDSKGEKKDE